MPKRHPSISGFWVGVALMYRETDRQGSLIDIQFDAEMNEWGSSDLLTHEKTLRHSARHYDS